MPAVSSAPVPDEGMPTPALIEFRLHTVHRQRIVLCDPLAARQKLNTVVLLCEPVPLNPESTLVTIVVGSFLCDTCWQDVMNVFLGLFRALDEVYRT